MTHVGLHQIVLWYINRMVFLGIQRTFILSGYTSQSELHGFGHNGGGHGIVIQYLRHLQHQSRLETSAYYWLPQFSVLSTFN